MVGAPGDGSQLRFVRGLQTSNPQFRRFSVPLIENPIADAKMFLPVTVCG
jgi:hypothetical protein